MVLFNNSFINHMFIFTPILLSWYIVEIVISQTFGRVYDHTLRGDGGGGNIK